MRKFGKFFAAMLLVGAFAAFAWAGGSWNDKPWSQWNSKDVDKLLSDSPWAKSVSVSANWLSESVMMNPGMTTQGPGNLSSGGAQGGPSGLGMRVRARAARFEARWISSLTLRRAIVRKAVLDGALTETGAEHKLEKLPVSYQVSLLGADMTPFSTLGLAAVLSDTYLEMKKTKKKLAPSGYKPEYSADGSRLVSITFSFPVTVGGRPTILPGETGIDLICRGKKVKLKFHFDPRKMLVDRDRDL